MRSMYFICAGLILAFAAACSVQSDDTGVQLGPQSSVETVTSSRQPVLVELFTSEGCSSCPPADKNLTFLEKQQPVTKADIITLAFHVDYWDRLGWKDRFSSPLFSQRQEEYSQALKLDSNYTPQMIVDGRAEFVGSNGGRATDEILKATENPKARVEINVEGNTAKVKIDGVPNHGNSTVFAAIAEDGISSRVERGENSGKTLEHVSVVHELKTMGSIAADASSFQGTLDVPTNPEWKSENLKIVVFVQENEGRKVFGVGRKGLNSEAAKRQ